jgi:hypothetical protein
VRVTTTETGPVEPVAWPPPPPLPAPKPRRWLVVATTAWAAVLVAAALFAIWRGQASTDREQTSIGTGKQAVDRAVGHLVAAGNDGVAVVEISDFTSLGDCRLSLVRSGVRYERAVSFYTAAGAEGALLTRIAQGLPPSYGARQLSGALPRISADGGGFVALSGGVIGPGHLRVIADTGCRQAGGDLADPRASAADRTPAQAALTALGVDSAQWHDLELPCPDGGHVWELRATATQPMAAQTLPTALGTLAEGKGVAVEPAVYAFRHGPVGVLVTTQDGTVTVSTTGGC